ncbi:MAG: hypothetical protein ACD_78C00274G0009 [uncultured bacterium (gcode 4)]|uniref:Uncharacterized protein n=1 Tax=uncultured bacterium (gcode 4) TaxID=1234023 RepID=K1XX36_9BACT|nr:MAG: hypothetical protein ACD_78C00274G0009 [uncultured bacterium (gcode 4)]
MAKNFRDVLVKHRDGTRATFASTQKQISSKKEELTLAKANCEKVAVGLSRLTDDKEQERQTKRLSLLEGKQRNIQASLDKMEGELPNLKAEAEKWQNRLDSFTNNSGSLSRAEADNITEDVLSKERGMMGQVMIILFLTIIGVFYMQVNPFISDLLLKRAENKVIDNLIMSDQDKQSSKVWIAGNIPMIKNAVFGTGVITGAPNNIGVILVTKTPKNYIEKNTLYPIDGAVALLVLLTLLVLYRGYIRHTALELETLIAPTIRDSTSYWKPQEY